MQAKGKRRSLVLLAVAAAALVVAFFFLSGALNPAVEASPVEEILLDPEPFMNTTITLKGRLETVPLPTPLGSPSPFGLFPKNPSDLAQVPFLYVNWTSTTTLIQGYNATTAIVRGVLIKVTWTDPYTQTPLQNYVLDAQKVDLPPQES